MASALHDHLVADLGLANRILHIRNVFRSRKRSAVSLLDGSTRTCTLNCWICHPVGFGVL